MNQYGKAVRDKFSLKAGCTFARHAKADRHLYRRQGGKRLTVPVKIMSRHTANEILKDAGLPKAF